MRSPVCCVRFVLDIDCNIVAFVLLAKCLWFVAALAPNEAIDQLAVVNSVCWCGHVLRDELELLVNDDGKKKSLKRTWKRQVEEESMKVGVSRVDALFRPQWIVGVNLIATG